jgi:hypothetical protein
MLDILLLMSSALLLTLLVFLAVGNITTRRELHQLEARLLGLEFALSQSRLETVALQRYINKTQRWETAKEKGNEQIQKS